jgi:hypothetical protein
MNYEKQIASAVPVQPMNYSLLGLSDASESVRQDLLSSEFGFKSTNALHNAAQCAINMQYKNKTPKFE